VFKVLKNIFELCGLRSHFASQFSGKIAWITNRQIKDEKHIAADEGSEKRWRL